MKRWFLPLAIAAALAVPAFAADTQPGTAPAAAAPGAEREAPSADQMAAMRQAHEKMQALHQQMRVQMLGSLSAGHRNAVANIIGQLAVSAEPDPRGAAAKIDALLSSGEKQSIANALNNERQSRTTLMESIHQQMLASAPADQRAEMQARMDEHAARMKDMMTRMASQPMDPGMELLHLGIGEEHDVMYGSGMMGGHMGAGLMFMEGLGGPPH